MCQKGNGRYKAEDTVPDLEETKCIKYENNKSQCELSTRKG